MRRRRARRGVACILALAGVLACCAVAQATNIVVGGVDFNSQYTGFACQPTCTADSGILTFDDQFNTFNSPDDGEVTSANFFASALLGAQVKFEVDLSGTQNTGSGAFNPASTNIRWARFLGNGSDFVIFSGSTVLLAFDINYIDVSGFVRASNDPAGDGEVTLGSFSAASYQQLFGSDLRVAGGSLNQFVGGIGTPAVLHVKLISLIPSLGAPAGYFNTNILIGTGAAPGPSATIWDLTIIPEPATAALVGFGLLALVGAARRRVAPR